MPVSPRVNRPIGVVPRFCPVRVSPGTGTPSSVASMVLEVPSQQFRARYDFLVPDTYERNFLDVVAPRGSHPLLDGAPLGGAAERGRGHLGGPALGLGLGLGGADHGVGLVAAALPDRARDHRSDHGGEHDGEDQRDEHGGQHRLPRRRWQGAPAPSPATSAP